jgi:hypothetical protein
MKTTSLYNFSAQILRKTLEHMGILDSDFFSPNKNMILIYHKLQKKIDKSFKN